MTPPVIKEVDGAKDRRSLARANRSQRANQSRSWLGCSGSHCCGTRRWVGRREGLRGHWNGCFRSNTSRPQSWLLLAGRKANLTMGMQAATSAADISRELEEFLAIYEQRPIRANVGGMRFNHSFATWFMLKTLKPRVVIESGVWRGHSTWLIEQACPHARLYCLDLDFSRLTYRSAKAIYLQKDFAECAWLDVDHQEAVCFFDDHQNAYARLKDLRWAGFTRAIFEDNFPCGEGDCYTLRQMREGYGHEHIQMSQSHSGTAQDQEQRRSIENILRFIGPRQQVIVHANTDDRDLFARNCKEYFEFPPVVLAARTDWGAPYEGAYAPTPPFFALPAIPERLRSLIDTDPGELSYTFIAYVELR